MWQLLLVTSLISLTHITLCFSQNLYKNARLNPRIVQTRCGRLQGLILPLDSYKFLKPVEIFLGVPYATPPTKLNR